MVAAVSLNSLVSGLFGPGIVRRPHGTIPSTGSEPAEVPPEASDVVAFSSVDRVEISAAGRAAARAGASAEPTRRTTPDRQPAVGERLDLTA